MTTILLVDDSPLDRHLFGRLLEREGDLRVEYAEHGAEALEILQRSQPDLVVTDMQMPHMDGMQLVKAIRRAYPSVPVVLLTGKGSEALATKALQAGAAGYVPKSQGTELLLDTVRHLLDLARGEASYERLGECTDQAEFKLRLDNDRKLIDSLVALSQNLVANMGICDPTGRLQLGVALEQALLNAMYHGNLELSADQLSVDEAGGRRIPAGDAIQRRIAESPYRDRKISISVRIDRDEARFTISDEGPGFNVKQHSEVGLSASESKSGHGLFLMWAFMDRVSFNRAGNSVTLSKRRRAEAADQMPSSAPSADQRISDESPATVEDYGELIPQEGGKSIRLTKSRLIVGRDRSCDVVIKSAKVSHHHCLLHVYRGWWFVKDLGSTNGVKVNGVTVSQHRLSPGAVLSFGKASFKIEYLPYKLGAEGITPPPDPF